MRNVRLSACPDAPFVLSCLSVKSGAATATSPDTKPPDNDRTHAPGPIHPSVPVA